jgi:hypothetical protein
MPGAQSRKPGMMAGAAFPKCTLRGAVAPDCASLLQPDARPGLQEKAPAEATDRNKASSIEGTGPEARSRLNYSRSPRLRPHLTSRDVASVDTRR